MNAYVFAKRFMRLSMFSFLFISLASSSVLLDAFLYVLVIFFL